MQPEKENRLKTCLEKQNNSFNNTMATQHESRGLLISINTNSTMISTGILSNIMNIIELQNKQKVALHNLKGFSGFSPHGLYLSL